MGIAGILRSRQIRPVCLAVLFLLAVLSYRKPSDISNRPVDLETVTLARSLAQEGQFANPFAPLRTGPSAHLTPLFPIYLAFLLKALGDGPACWYACAAGAALATGILLAMLPLVSERLGMGFFTGFAAGLLWLAAKPDPARMWEGIYAAVLAATATCLLRLVLSRASRPSGAVAISLGAVLGILALTCPVASLPPGILAVAFIARQTGRRQRLKYAAYVLVTPALILLPWVTRNWVVFHQFIPLRDDLGLTLAVSNNDCAAYGVRLSQVVGCFQQNHPNESLEQAALVKQLGEPKYNSLRLHQALGWISSHPKRFLDLCLQRAMAFWFPTDSGNPLDELRDSTHRTLRLVVYGATLLSIPGLFMLARRDRTSALICLVWLACYPAVYYVVQYDQRYRLPILWLTFLLGVFPVTALVSRLLIPQETARSSPCRASESRSR